MGLLRNGTVRCAHLVESFIVESMATSRGNTRVAAAGESSKESETVYYVVVVISWVLMVLVLPPAIRGVPARALAILSGGVAYFSPSPGVI